MKKSWMETHPHVRRLVYGAALLLALFALREMFGRDETLALLRGILETAGVLGPVEAMK